MLLGFRQIKSFINISFKCSFALSSFLCLFFFSISCSLQAQENYRLQFLNQSAQEVVKKLEAELSITINFNHDFLPNDKFSFACNGTIDDILAISATILDRRIKRLDQNIFTIQNVPLEPAEKIKKSTISAIVKDDFDQLLTGATAWIPSIEKASLTNAIGRFELSGYFDKEDHLEINYLGYETAIIKIDRLLQNKNAVIILATKTHLLTDIEIVDYLSWNDNSANNNSDIIRLKKTTPLPGKFDADVLSITQVLPGIYSASESVSEIQIRGGSPDQTHFEWNNIQVFQTSHFFGKVSSINPFLVDQININKNGGSAEDSGQASGKIALSNQNRANDSLSLRLHSNLLYSNLGFRTPLFKKKLKIEFAWRKSYNDFFRSVVYDRFFNQTFQSGRVTDENYYRDFFDIGDIVSLSSRNNFEDLMGSLSWQISPKDQVSISALKIYNILTYEKVNDYWENYSTDSLILQNKGLSINYERNWTSKIQTTINWSKSNYENRYRYLYRTDPELRPIDEDVQFNKIDQSVFQVSNSYQSRFFKFSIGYQREQWQHENLSFNRQVDSTAIYFDSNISAFEHSAFAQLLWHSSPIWQAEAGLRWSKYSLGREQLYEPRFHFSVFPAKSWTIHGHLGWYHQTLNQSSTFTPLRVEERFWYLSDETNPNDWLFLVRNRQIGIGTRYHKKAWTFSADIYHKKIHDIFTPTLDFTFLSDPYQYSDMYIKGFELSAQLERKYFSMLWAYDYVHDRIVTSDGTSFLSHFSQPHRISLLQTVQLKKWSLALNWKFATGRPFSVPTELKTTTNANGDLSYNLVFDELLTERIKNYHSLDLSLSYKLGNKKQSKIHGQIACSISNLYNRQNIIKNWYFVDYKREPVDIGLLAKQGLPFTPNLSIDLFFN